MPVLPASPRARVSSTVSPTVSWRRTLALVATLAIALPGCASAPARHAVALYDAGDYAGAARASDAGLADHPDDEGLWQMRIRAALAQGDGAAIASAYERYRGHLGHDDRALCRELATATLGQALAAPSVKIKIAAINAIAELELHDLADQVAARMGDDDDRVAASAAIAVLRGMPGAPQVASDLLRSEDPEARRIAVEGIARKVGALAKADVERAGGDDDPRVRRAAVRWLGQLVDKDAIELLTRRLHDDDDGVRAAAASALARIGVGDLAAFAATALADRALGVRLAGVELLVAAHRDDLLARLGDDADPMIATRAGIARRRTEPLAAGRAIARALAAPEWTIRAGAANLLASAVAADVADQLARALLKDPVLAVRLAAARVLAHGGDKATALEQFARALGATTGEELQAATDLAALGDPRGAAALGQFLHDPARTADQRAAAAAAHRGGRQITPQLVAALADPSGQVRVEAAAALGALAR